MTTETIVGYLYRDEYYCPGCIAAVDGKTTTWARLHGTRETEDVLDIIARLCGFDRTRPASFSQRDFPHTITSGQLDEPASLCETCRTEIR